MAPSRSFRTSEIVHKIRARILVRQSLFCTSISQPRQTRRRISGSSRDPAALLRRQDNSRPPRLLWKTLPSEARTAETLASRATSASDAFDVGQDRRDAAAPRLRRGSERHAAGTAVEQLLAQRLFRFCDLHASWRLEGVTNVEDHIISHRYGPRASSIRSSKFGIILRGVNARQASCLGQSGQPRGRHAVAPTTRAV
jgi:hypothetical protein